MFNLIKSYNNISIFEQIGEFLYYFEKENLYFRKINLKDEILIWQVKINIDCIYYKDFENIIIIGDGNVSYIVEKHTSEIVNITESQFFDFCLFKESNFLIPITKRISLLSVESGVYNLKENRILFLDSNYFVFGVFKQIILGKENIKLLRYSEKGELIWHFNLESLYESHPAPMAEYLADPVNSQYYKPIIGNIVGVHNGLLWLDIDMTYHSNFLLALDAETGDVEHFLQHIHPQKDFDGLCIDGRPNRMPMYSQTHLDEKRNILFGFGADIFHWQVDLNDQNPKIKMWDLGIEAKNAKGHFSALANCGVSDSHVFFPVGSIGDISPGVIGLNRDTLEVDYRLYLEPTKDYYTPTKIKVSDTHLFVLDNNSTLSVYEKTED